MGNVRLKYSYERGIIEIKKAWDILQEGRVGIGKIAHNLLLGSTKRKPITLKKIAEDTGVNYSTLKRYHGFYIDIIKHLPPAQQKSITVGVLNRTSKQISKILNKGYDDPKHKKGAVHKASLESVPVPPKTVRALVYAELKRTKEEVKMKRLLGNGYEIANFIKHNELSPSQLKQFEKMINEINKSMSTSSC